MALVPFPGPPGKPSPHDLDPDPGYRTEGNRILRRDPGADGDRDDDESDDGEAKMSFLEHLDELRKRIIYAAASIFVGFVIAFIFIQQLFDFVMTQVWLFIAPGLYSHEKKMAIPFVVLSSICFVAGAAFSHYIVFPLTWKFFVSFTSDYLTFMPRIEPAFDLYIKMILAFGLVFQMPTIVLLIAKMGVVTARFLWRHTKYAILIIVIVSAIVTPDGGGVSLVAMSIPLFFLYLFSIGLAWMFGKKQKTNADIPYDL